MPRRDFEYLQSVRVENLILDTANARIRTGVDDQDCIHKILKQEVQFLNLLRDILEKGLSTIPILVEPVGSSQYKVWDGNRRVAALKLINNPGLCSDSRIRKIIEAEVSKNNFGELESIDCMSSNVESSLIEEVVLRHSGSLDGRGQQDWSAFLRTVFLVGRNLPSNDKRAAQYLLWAEENGVLIQDDFPITTITRLFNRDNIRVLGFDIVHDELSLQVSRPKALLAAEKLVAEFYTRKVKVDDVYTPSQASAYISGIARSVGLMTEDQQPTINPSKAGLDLGVKDSPAQPGASSDPAQSPTKPDQEPQYPDPQPQQPPPPRGRGTTKPSWDRNGLFYRKKHGLTVPRDKAKIQTIVNELTRLKVDGKDGTPTAVAVLFRALIELCVDHYNAKHQIFKNDEHFHRKVAKVADSLEANSSIDKDLYDVVISRSREENGILNVKTLHKYVHSDASHANKQVLNSLWDELGEFLAACLRY